MYSILVCADTVSYTHLCSYRIRWIYGSSEKCLRFKSLLCRRSCGRCRRLAGRSARRGSEIDQRCSERSRESTESLSARRKPEVCLLYTSKVVIITGSGAGIGQAAAVAFAREGAKVVVNSVTEKSGAETLALVEKQGGCLLYTSRCV